MKVLLTTVDGEVQELLWGETEVPGLEFFSDDKGNEIFYPHHVIAAITVVKD